MRGILLALFFVSISTGFAGAQSTAQSEIAPSGSLRSGFIGIRVLGGVGEPIGRFIADRLGLTFTPVVYPNPDTYERSFGKDEWDIALGPRVLAPVDKTDSTADIWLIDLQYLAGSRREFADPDQVDRPGVRIATIQNSPSDRVLTKTLKSAELIRLPLTPAFPADAIALLREGGTDVFGADAGLISVIASGYPEGKLVPGVFNTVHVAATLPKGRSSKAQAKLAEIVSEAKKNGIVQKAIEHAGVASGVHVAPE
jgi:polar amino acid transport system substrate-binding protein